MLSYGSSIGTQTCKQIGNKYYKVDSRGYESIAEVVSDELLNCIKGLNHVPYYLTEVKQGGRIQSACYSFNMLKGNETMISIYDVLDDEDGYFWYCFGDKSPEDKVNAVTDGIEEVLNIPKEGTLLMLSNTIKFDYLIRNEDRHFGNISFIFDGEKYRFAPIYDNGLSLLSNTILYPLEEKNFVDMLNATRSRPFNSSFEKQVTLFKDLPKLQIDINRFFNRMKEAIDCINSCVPFKQEGFKRCLKVLDYTLSKSHGKVWEEWVS